jgi:hypothetical protein
MFTFMFKTFSKFAMIVGLAMGATLSVGAMAAHASPVPQAPPSSSHCITMGTDKLGTPVIPGGGSKNCCPADHVTEGITGQDGNRNSQDQNGNCSCPGSVNTGPLVTSDYQGAQAGNCDPCPTPQPCNCQPPVKNPCPVSRPGGNDPGSHHTPCPPKQPKPCKSHTTPKDPCGNSHSTWK